MNRIDHRFDLISSVSCSVVLVLRKVYENEEVPPSCHLPWYVDFCLRRVCKESERLIVTVCCASNKISWVVGGVEGTAKDIPRELDEI